VSDQDLLVTGGSKPRAIVIVPNTGHISFYTVYWMMRQAPEVAVLPYLHKRTGFVEDMRQKIANIFVETGIEWLMMCDADTAPSFPVMRAIARAESLGKNEEGHYVASVVAYPTPFIGNYPGVASNLFVAAEDTEMPGQMILGGVPWHDLPWDDTDPNGNKKMFEIAGAGFGCTLIHRDVVLRLMKLAESGELTDWPFRAIFQKGELYYGEDQAFFIRVQGALGLPVYSDLECWCSHYKNLLMNPNLARDWFLGMKRDPLKSGAPYDPTQYPRAKFGKVQNPDESVMRKVVLTDPEPDQKKTP
jgi:hypothetical protein